MAGGKLGFFGNLRSAAMTQERPERRLTAVLAADVAGYSRLMGVDEEGTLAALKEARVAAADHAKVTQSAVAAALNAAAERIEGITRRLNRTLPADHESPAHEPSARGSVRENGVDRAEKAIPSMVAAGRLSD